MRRQFAGIAIAAVLGVGVALAAGGVAASGSAVPTATFAYSGDNGPGFWGQLNPDWAACTGDGGSQSPIDINNVRIDPRLKALNLNLTRTPIALTNNGHSIEEEYRPDSTLTFDGVTYHLQQFHFHALSEHTIRGWRGVMELHAVFKDDLVNTKKIAVVALLYKIGHKNPFLAKLSAGGLPMKEGQTVDSTVKGQPGQRAHRHVRLLHLRGIAHDAALL